MKGIFPEPSSTCPEGPDAPPPPPPPLDPDDGMLITVG